MKQWEYLTIEVEEKNSRFHETGGAPKKSIYEIANGYGKEGWELVGINVERYMDTNYNQSFTHLLWFKREIQENPAQPPSSSL